MKAQNTLTRFEIRFETYFFARDLEDHSVIEGELTKTKSPKFAALVEKKFTDDTTASDIREMAETLKIKTTKRSY